MKERPVILLSFANQQDAYLQNLKKESGILNDILSPHHDKGTVEVYREESASVDDIAKAINRFKDRIILFHYAGHADGDHLYFERGSGNAAGIANLLGQLPELKFVFLNGCSTTAQVEELLNNGVPAVIATAVPIDDEKAVVFAEHFYRAFSTKNNVEAAFNFAVATMRTKYGGDFLPTIVKKGEKPASWSDNQMPWGLYLNDQAEKVLSWTIPTHFTTKISRPEEGDYEVNRFMVDIIDAMIEHDEDLLRLAYNEADELIDERQALSLIIEHFPWPIGVQIRLLVTKESDVDSPSFERIKQLVSTYIVSAQFLFYVVLSQLWDEKRQRSFRVRSYITDLLNNKKENFNYFDYLKYFVDVVKLLKGNDCGLFVNEFDDFVREFDEKGELFNAYQYMESLRSMINSQETGAIEAEKYQLCADGEYFLSSILIKISFLVNYDLLTIRDIHVVNHRYLGASFNHFIGHLNAKVTNLVVTRTPRPRSYTSYANNASVVLTKDIQDPATFLNLSPFIIDKNAFGEGMTEERATEQQLFMYAFRQEEEFTYLATIHNIYRVQERHADQLMTNEGEIEAEQSSRSKRRSRRSRRSINEQQESPYKVLKEQFQIFEKDLNL